MQKVKSTLQTVLDVVPVLLAMLYAIGFALVWFVQNGQPQDLDLYLWPLAFAFIAGFLAAFRAALNYQATQCQSCGQSLDELGIYQSMVFALSFFAIGPVVGSILVFGQEASPIWMLVCGSGWGVLVITCVFLRGEKGLEPAF